MQCRYCGRESAGEICSNCYRKRKQVRGLLEVLKPFKEIEEEKKKRSEHKKAHDR